MSKFNVLRIQWICRVKRGRSHYKKVYLFRFQWICRIKWAEFLCQCLFNKNSMNSRNIKGICIFIMNSKYLWSKMEYIAI